jgi:hypothetical protein
MACARQPTDGAAVPVDPRNGSAGSGVNADARAFLGRIVIAAGDLDRNHSIVSFPLAPDAARASILRDEKGGVIPLQRGADGSATFVLRALAQGQKAAFSLESADLAATARPSAIDRGKALDLSDGARVVVRFQKLGELPPGIDPVYLRGGYLHPLYTPAGVEVTGDYPESHHHQHGIWSAWTRSRFGEHAIDFWNMDDRQGKVDFQSLEQRFSGPVFAGFTARLAHIDLLGSAPVVALDERWTVTTYRTHEGTPPYFVVDLVSTQRTATDTPLLLEQYSYGGFALRGNARWSDPANVTFLTSEGLDRAAGDDEKGRWCAIGGTIDGAWAGFAMLGHPENFRAPQTFRIHPKHPYMAFAPVKDGPFTIEPGKPYVSRFRIVSFDGPIDRELIERLWRDYATPPKVIVEVL